MKKVERDIEDIIKDIDGVDSMKKVNELLDALSKRKDDLMCNDVKRIALIYAKMLNARSGEFTIINSISSILRKYISGTDIRNITDDDWYALKEILFPKIPDNHKPILSEEEFDRLYPNSRSLTESFFNLEYPDDITEESNDTTSVPPSSC